MFLKSRPKMLDYRALYHQGYQSHFFPFVLKATRQASLHWKAFPQPASLLQRTEEDLLHSLSAPQSCPQRNWALLLHFRSPSQRGRNSVWRRGRRGVQRVSVSAKYQKTSGSNTTVVTVLLARIIVIENQSYRCFVNEKALTNQRIYI